MIVERIMFGAKCDHCKKYWLDEHNGFIAMSDESSMKSILSDEGWHSGDTKSDEGKNGEHYCSECWSYNDNDEFILNPKRLNIHDKN